MSDWIVIFRDAVVSTAGVTVYDKGRNDVLGRYVLAKTMKLANGKTRSTQSYYCQRPAALRRAVKFLCQRAALAGLEYVPGEGKKTMGYAPVAVEKGGALCG